MGKSILVLTLIVFPFNLISQQLHGTIVFRKEVKAGITIIAEKKNWSKDDPRPAAFVENGSFLLKVPEEGLYQIIIDCLPENDTTFNVLFKKDTILDLTFWYPPIHCPYSNISGVCPEGHKEDVVPIIYGDFFKYKRELKKQLRRKEIKLGGGLLRECQPSWFCKIHNKSF